MVYEVGEDRTTREEYIYHSEFQCWVLVRDFSATTSHIKQIINTYLIPNATQYHGI